MKRRSMVRGLSLLALVSGGIVATAPSRAEAQTRGFAVDRYEPTPTDLFFAAEHPWYSRGSNFAIRGGLVFDYAHNPLVFRNASGMVSPVIADMLLVHAQLGIAIFNRLGVNVSMPFVLIESGGSTTNNGTTLAAAGHPAIGDLRVGLRLRIVGDADRDPASIHISANGFVPIGARENNASDGAFRARGQVTLAGHPGPVRYSVGVGFQYRPDFATGARSVVGSELLASAAIGLVAANDRLTIGPEAWIAGNVGHLDDSLSWSAEGLLGIHYLFADTILVGGGVGMGFTHGPGTPQARALLQIAYAPSAHEHAAPPPARPVDSDRDGVLDPDDQCTYEPSGDHPDPARRGCPLRDRDNDGVFDPDDACVDEPRGDHPDPARSGCPARDTDGDGVFDFADQCVDVAAGSRPDPQRAGCPDVDTDHDGVFDSEDQCRTEPIGLHADPARNGCPAPDRDRDTVPDGPDHCPDQPGAPSPDPNRNGCPGLVRVDNGALRILAPVYFATSRDRILPRSFPVLTAVADALRATESIRRVAIEGHTDNAGDDARNLDLSQRRANSVMTWLTSHGIVATRLEAHGYGETRPIATNDTAAGRAQNRRVVFNIVDPPSASASPSPQP